MMCGKCGKVSSGLLLLIGVLFLLKDVGVWNFFGLEWWTVGFLLLGFIGFAKGSCKDCKKMCK